MDDINRRDLVRGMAFGPAVTAPRIRNRPDVLARNARAAPAQDHQRQGHSLRAE